MNVLSKEGDKVRQARTETIPLTGELKGRNILLSIENLDLEAEIRDLKEDISDLKAEIREWEETSGPYEDYEDYEDRAEAIRYFCYECPLKGSLSCCTCFLHKYREEKIWLWE